MSALTAEARAIANIGVQTDDGFKYTVPASALVRYNELLRDLAAEVDKQQRTIDRLRNSGRLAKVISNAIGYAPVPLSIRNHPEIKAEYRTVEDRDGLVERISAAILKEIEESS